MVTSSSITGGARIGQGLGQVSLVRSNVTFSSVSHGRHFVFRGILRNQTGTVMMTSGVEILVIQRVFFLIGHGLIFNDRHG